MNITIRQEQPQDHNEVFKLIKAAFANEDYSDHTEQDLVERLRDSDEFIPYLSLIACMGTRIVGHVLMTRMYLDTGDKRMEGLALAPVSVLPEFQNKGIGTKLIQEVHQIAEEHEHAFAVVVGHKDYYPRFDYQTLDQDKIKMPFEVASDHCFIRTFDQKLDPDELKGSLIYSSAFIE